MPMPQIKHIVHLMLENRSFDNVLGWLHDCNNPPSDLNVISNKSQEHVSFYGLEEDKYFNCFENDDTKHYVQKGVSEFDTPWPDPHEEYQHVNFQLFYPGWQSTECPTDCNNSPGELSATMMGFLANYKTAKKYYKFCSIDDAEALQIMKTYTPYQLSVLNGLAKDFAVSDYWFSSVPSQTNTNRAYSICGSSLATLDGTPQGLVNNHGAWFGIIPSTFTGTPIWKILSDHGNGSTDDWMIYFQHPYKEWFHKDPYIYTRSAFNFDGIPDADSHFARLDQFYSAVKNGKLPKFSYIEPDWIGLLEVIGLERDTYKPNSYHPPGEVGPGEQFVKCVYDALTGQSADFTDEQNRKARESWKHTLFIITFDEHGGTYDHVPPPPAEAPTDGTPGECGFDFKRFGVRVPAILVSPWIEPQTVFRSTTSVPYDHTSVIKTVLEWDQWNTIPTSAIEAMGHRVAAAPTFDGVLQRTEPRTDVPKVTVHAPLSEPGFTDEKPPCGLQGFILPRMLHKMSDGKLDPDEAESKSKAIMESAHSLADVHKAIAEFADLHGNGQRG